MFDHIFEGQFLLWYLKKGTISWPGYGHEGILHLLVARVSEVRGGSQGMTRIKGIVPAHHVLN